MSLEVIIAGMSGVTTAMQTIAKRTGLSITALTAAGGTSGTLGSIGTGKSRSKDMAIGPLFRVLKAVNWELVGRTVDPRGIVVTPEGGVELLVTAGDGGRLEVAVSNLEELRLLLNTMAAANWMTISALNAKAGLAGGTMVGVATGASTNQDVRLNGLVKIAQTAQFELVVRPVHKTLRQARVALAAAHRS